ncbi:MAG TPA: hypothetical protein VG144_10990 [Gaiellaceae bacterium]|nr:hypothetical protein [Gaiellaceae bacterium]
MDPWHDYLAIPIAPLVLAAQFVALFLRNRPLRLFLAVACPTAIAVMFAYVSSLPIRPDEGVNIGAGVLLLWFLVSLALLAVAAVREAVTYARRTRS